MRLGFSKRADWDEVLRIARTIKSHWTAVCEIGGSTVSRTSVLIPLTDSLLIVEKEIERVPRKVAYKRICADWTALDRLFVSAPFDLILANHVLEHVEDDLGCLRATGRALVPGGVALLVTPNRKRLTRTVIELFTGPRKFPFWEHVREYDMHDMESLLLKADVDGSVEFSPMFFGVVTSAFAIYISPCPRIFVRWCTFWLISIKR